MLAPIIEHLTERIKNLLADLLDTKKTKPYWGIWLAPLITYLFSLLFVFILNIPDKFIVALIPTGASIIWYEVSNIWKKQKRESVPLRTKGLAETIKDIKL